MSDSGPTTREPIKDSDDWQVEVSDLEPPRPRKSVRAARLRRIMQRWQLPQYRRRVRKIGNASLFLLVVLAILLLSGNDFFALLANGVRASFGLHSQANTPSHVATVRHDDFLITRPPRLHGQDKLACLLDTQWSPKGDAIAVLGYEYGCPNSIEEPGILNLYDARTATVIAQWQPDDTILNVINAPAPKSQTVPSVGVTAVSSYGNASTGSENVGSTRLLAFSYVHVMWSPDEQQLAISFLVYFDPHPDFGLLVLNVQSNAARVIFQPPNLTPQMPVEWDFATGQALGLTTISPALSYHWTASGSLLPDSSLSVRPQKQISALGPVGNPDGNTSFTIWQPGFATLTNISGYFAWNTTFSAWSPDGRYLVDGISMVGLFEPPGSVSPNAQALSQVKAQHYALLPARDAALLKVAINSAEIAWRPDGRVLATYNGYGFVALYDCQTGRLLKTLPLPFDQAPSIDGNTELLRWSPDGSRLLLSSALDGVLHIWDSSQLS